MKEKRKERGIHLSVKKKKKIKENNNMVNERTYAKRKVEKEGRLPAGNEVREEGTDIS